VIAIDTNLLVYAHRADSPWHEAAAAVVRRLAEGSGAWAVPWPCIHEFLAIVTHPRIYRPPTPLAAALAQVDAWFESPTLTVIGEGSGHWPALKAQATAGRLAGPQIHDARVAAICADHGVREIWTADRDFSRLPEVRAVNPLVR
jgi:uncharacterized protein